MKDSIQLKGTLELFHHDQAGVLKSHDVINNLVVTAGKQWLIQRMINVSSAVMSHMAIGTGNNESSVGMTALETQVARVALTSSVASGTSIIYTATFGAGVGTGAITEAAVLNASTGGTMLNRAKFNPRQKDSGDSITIVWTVNLI